MTRDVEDRLRDAFAAGAELVSPQSLKATGTPAAVRPRRGVRGLPVLAAASVAVVLGAVAIVPSLLGSSAAPPGGSAEAPTRFTAVVDALARRAEQPRAYWRSESETLTWGRPAKQAYNIEDSVRRVFWSTPRGPAVETTPLYTRPDTAADERKWRAAGAPDLCGFQVGCEGVRDRRGRADYHFPKGFEIGGVSLTRAQFLALPQDPRRLEAELLRLQAPTHQESTGPSGSFVKQYSEQDTLWLMGEGILMNTPAPPAVRAAALRMMAALPGARTVDQARDADGRTGMAIVRKVDRDPLERRLVIDRSSGDVLGTTTLVAGPLPESAGLEVGDMAAAQVVRALGWTGDGPRLPEGCVQQAGKTCVGS
ncbi:CU044_5270 family protein [Nonomuraea sp. NPDC050783]|uniref:CU044_5270 family protein n=1 Tax=Nonomuraea sp. NPDC050783 TaxID=3154634 RepID=UPI00346523F1